MYCRFIWIEGGPELMNFFKFVNLPIVVNFSNHKNLCWQQWQVGTILAEHKQRQVPKSLLQFTVVKHNGPDEGCWRVCVCVMLM